MHHTQRCIGVKGESVVLGAGEHMGHRISGEGLEEAGDAM